MRYFFTADTHFGHDAIIKYCDRPFKHSNEMDRVLVDNWNAVVGKKDIVYHLGDFAFGSSDYAAKMLNKLNGSIHLIEVNHDDKALSSIKSKFASYKQLSDIKIHGQKITLCHYPMLSWRSSFHGAWHLFGHVHGKLENPAPFSIDVGVD